MTSFESALAGFAALDEDTLGRPWTWRERTMDVRYALYRTLEDAQEAHARAAAGAHAESRRILAQAQGALGDLRGLLTGLPDPLLDRPPAAGAWSIRETLRHVHLIERRYAIQTLYAVERDDAAPIRIEDQKMPPLDAMDDTGDASALLARIAVAREETNRGLANVPPDRMTRPTVWAGHAVDVRFRLLRFGAHLIEHTIQCEKTLAAIGWPLTEGRRIARRVAAQLGELDGLGASGEARALEGALAERYASVRAAMP